MLRLSSLDKVQIGLARSANAITEINEQEIQKLGSFVHIGCPDCDVIGGYCRHIWKVTGHARHHMLGLNGGALLLSPYSPIRGARTDGRVLLRHVNAAARMKSIQTVALSVHAPCGAAYGKKLDFFEVLRLLVEAKKRLRAQHDASKHRIVCLVHVNYNGDSGDPQKERTYCVNREKATVLLEVQGRQIRN